MKKIILTGFFGLLIIFTMNAQSLTLTFPTGGEHWMRNLEVPHNIEWTQTNVANIKIEFSSNAGVSWTTIVDNYPASSGFYNWQTADLVSNECLIKISDVLNPTLYTDQTDTYFSILEHQIFYAQWTTDMGVITSELRGDYAPMTVQNFINLVERGFYDNLKFHRVVDNFVIQDGDPLGNGTGGPEWSINLEISQALRHNTSGILAMARANEPNSAGSQYYFTIGAQNFLDNNYAVYGRAIEGVNVIHDIGKVAVNGNDEPITPVNIQSINMVEYNPVLTIINPQNGTEVIENSDIIITWSSEFYADLKIEFSSDNGVSWETLEDSIPAYTQSFAWTTPETPSTECIIKLTSLRNSNNFVQHTIPFIIKNKPVTYDRIECYENITPTEDNPENYFSPGKKFKFRIRLSNDYTETLSALSAELTTTSQYITITNSSINFPSVNAGEFTWSDEEIEITVSETVPSKADYNFELNITDGNVLDLPWICKFSIPLLTKGMYPKLDDDNIPDSYGNNNKTIEPGEIAELKINLSNTSSSEIFETFGKLLSKSSNISIWNNIQGATEIVYDTTHYNKNPIPANSIIVYPLHDFVFNYTALDTYYTELLLEVTAFINEAEGTNWDNGGIKIMYEIPYIINSSYPSQITDVNRDNSFNFEIFPNPASENFEISVSDYSNTDNYFIAIFDLLGKNIFEDKLIMNSEKYLIQTNLKSGIYIIKLKNSNNIEKSKILIINQ